MLGATSTTRRVMLGKAEKGSGNFGISSSEQPVNMGELRYIKILLTNTQAVSHDSSCHIFYACPIVAWGDITINYRIRTIFSGMVITEIWVAGSTKTKTLYDPLIEWESIPSLKKRQSMAEHRTQKAGFCRRWLRYGLFHVVPTVWNGQ